MHAITRQGLVAAVWFGGLGGTPVEAADPLTGTYTLQGTKGAVTLVLNQEANGKVSGQLTGGELALVLKGMAQPTGIVVGAMANAQGQFHSYFQVARVGDQVAFDFIGTNARNEPDLTKRTRVSFPVASPGEPRPPAAGGDPLAAGAPLGNTPAVAAPRFGGTFKGDGLTIESLATAAGYAGIIKLGEQDFRFPRGWTGRAWSGFSKVPTASSTSRPY